MGLAWPGMYTGGGDIVGATQQAITAMMDEFADAVQERMTKSGIQLYASPLWRPWSLVVVRDSEKILAAFGPLLGGIASIRWLDQSHKTFSPDEVITYVVSQLGMPISTIVSLPRPDISTSSASMRSAVDRHIAEVERANRLGRLGDLTGLAHLEPFLQMFLDDHPNPARNAFVMMRFIASLQMKEIYQTIREVSAAYGFHGVRADDRDYTGELWSNIQVYMTCCQYGIAVFEDIEQRDFNPNVSLELGYMLGKGKRSLILKERRLPNLPADVVHRLYKPFDMFDIGNSISREVSRWIETDLGLTRIDPSAGR